jgi:hypothetical protein
MTPYKWMHLQQKRSHSCGLFALASSLPGDVALSPFMTPMRASKGSVAERARRPFAISAERTSSSFLSVTSLWPLASDTGSVNLLEQVRHNSVQGAASSRPTARAKDRLVW